MKVYIAAARVWPFRAEVGNVDQHFSTIECFGVFATPEMAREQIRHTKALYSPPIPVKRVRLPVDWFVIEAETFE